MLSRSGESGDTKDVFWSEIDGRVRVCWWLAGAGVFLTLNLLG
jgi:hypothetical protein